MSQTEEDVIVLNVSTDTSGKTVVVKDQSAQNIITVSSHRPNTSGFPDDFQSFTEVEGETLGSAQTDSYYFLVDSQVQDDVEYKKLDSNGLLSIFAQQVADYLIDNGFLSSDDISSDGLLADMNGDGIVGTQDLLILLGQYGATTNNIESNFVYSSAPPSDSLQTSEYTEQVWVDIPLDGTSTRVGNPNSAAWNISVDGNYIVLEDWIVINDDGQTVGQTSLYGSWKQVSSTKSFSFDGSVNWLFNTWDHGSLQAVIEFYEDETLRATEYYQSENYAASYVQDGTDVSVTSTLNYDLANFVTDNWPSEDELINKIKVKLQAKAYSGNIDSASIADNTKFKISIGNPTSQ